MDGNEGVLTMPKRPHRRRPGDAKPLGEPGDSFTVAEAAAEMRVSVATMREWLAKRIIGHSKPQGKVLIERSEIQRLKDESRVPALPRRA